jgi:hypothetical protein
MHLQAKKPSFIVRAKNWQVFLFVCVPHFAGQLFMLIVTPRSESQVALGVLNAVALIFTAGYFVWFWIIGSFLTSLVKPSLKMSSRVFRFALIFPPLYWLLAVGIPQMTMLTTLIGGFCAVCCFGYVLYFVSKNLVLVEKGARASFLECAEPFGLLLFFPLGIWILQSRVNRIAEGT